MPGNDNICLDRLSLSDAFIKLFGRGARIVIVCDKETAICKLSSNSSQDYMDLPCSNAFAKGCLPLS